IEPSSAHFELEGFTRRDRMGEQLDDTWKIVRMCGAAGPPALELVERLAKVLENLAVDEFDLTAGRKGRDEPWNAVHDQAQLTFAFAQSRVGVVRVDERSVSHGHSCSVARHGA